MLWPSRLCYTTLLSLIPSHVLQELCKVPKLSVDGSTCSDLSEGELGNRWFVAACCSLAREPTLWQKVEKTCVLMLLILLLLLM